MPISPRPRGPSRLGLALTFCLLVGLLVWRWAVPSAPLWLDVALLAVVGAMLLAVRARIAR